MCARSTPVNVQIPRSPPPPSPLLEIVTFGDINIWIYVPTILPSLRVLSLFPEGEAVHSTDFFFFFLEIVFFGRGCFFPSAAGTSREN